MTPITEQSTEAKALLTVLHDGPVVGVSRLIERRMAGERADGARLREQLVALRMLVDQGLVSSARVGDALRLALTLRGRQAARRLARPSGEPRIVVRPWAFAGGFAAIAAGGCMTAVQTPPPRVPLMGYPSPVGVQQVRLADASYFMPCNPCANPSPKTPVLTGEVAGDAPRPERRVAERPVSLQPDSVISQVAIAPAVASATTPRIAAAPSVLTPVPSREPIKLTIQFGFGEALISRADRDALRELAPKASLAPEVSVQGGTDARGSIAANVALAQARTNAVRAELEKLGVPASRIRASQCVTCYVATNETAEGRKRNRRVDIEVARAGAQQVAQTR